MIKRSRSVQILDDCDDRDRSFTFDWFGVGSLLEQAVIHVINSSTHEALDKMWEARSSQRLNRIIGDALIDQAMMRSTSKRFSFKLKDLGGQPFITVIDAADGKIYMNWQN